ncbi:MAG: hypothetical protein LBT51_10900 [Fusobacteriaceae bacterium]|jgi:hypothetical protein|nr:hypothetical protein [Fusobacteriaceae bacterium]
MKWNTIFYLISLFLILLFPTFKLDDKEIDEKEKRTLSKFPFLFKEKINLKFGLQLEAWVNDHFSNRRKIIDKYLMFDKILSGRIENNRAFMGKERWLFYKGDSSIENYQNKNLYSNEQLEKIKNNLIKRNNLLEKHGIKYYTFIAPDKNKVYGEFYPNYIRKINNTGKVEHVIEFLKDSTSCQNREGGSIIYPLDNLMNAKNIGLIYWKTDTHWNSYGAFLGYMTLIENIKIDFSEITELKIENFDLIEKPWLSGDLLNMLNLNLEYYKNDQYFELIPKEVYKFEKLLVDKNKPYSIITKNKNGNNLKVLIFRDSFIESMIPYISETFSEVEYIWDHNFNSYQKKIIKEKPDIVIHEMVERSIDVLLRDTPEL